MCEDPERDWYPQLEVCYPTMARQQAQAKWARLHSDEESAWHDGTFTTWAKKPSAAHPFHRDHGVTIWVAGEELGLGGEFLQSGVAEEGDGEQPEAEHSKHHPDHAGGG